MTENLDVEKADCQVVASNICDGIEDGILDIFPDAMSKELSEKIGYKNFIL